MSQNQVKCAYCNRASRLPGQATCSERCQAYFSCNDRNCACFISECVSCRKKTKVGEVTCSNECTHEADIDLAPADYDAIFYPHG